jgi:probable F420-dependent oxidoreductase
LQVATGIVNIWTADADEVADSYHRIENAFPGRFLLGVGVGHPEHTQEYRKPYDALVEYLDALDAKKVPTSRRVIAALGKKVHELAAKRSAGAHPYLTTPEHTAQAREWIGPTVYLAPEHKVVLTEDADAARAIGRETVDFYLNLSNYLNNWKRLGFTDEDIAKPGSDKLIDAVVAHGSADDIATRLNEHPDAGADVLAVEPDQRMAGMAAAKGVRVEHATFEEWQPAGRTFDLVVFAQSFHWVDPVPALTKVASILRPGGLLVLLANRIVPTAPTQQQLDEINADYLDVTATSDVNAENEVTGHIEQSGFSIERRTCTEQLHYQGEDYLNLVFTYSNRLVLDPTAQAELRSRLARRIGTAGVDAHNDAVAIVCTPTVA